MKATYSLCSTWNTFSIIWTHPWILILISISQFLLKCIRVLEETDCRPTNFLCYEIWEGKIVVKLKTQFPGLDISPWWPYQEPGLSHSLEIVFLSNTCLKPVSVDIRVSRIYRHLTATPSFGGQTASAGGTPRLSYLPFQTMELLLNGDNTVDS